MNNNRLSSQTLDELKRAAKRKYKPTKMEFSKKLMILSVFFYGFLCIVSLVSWFISGEWPQEIVTNFTWPFTTALASYMGKSAYENKTKIQGGEQL